MHTLDGVYWVQRQDSGVPRLWVLKSALDDRTQRFLNTLAFGGAEDAENTEALVWDLPMSQDAVERLAGRLFS